MKKFENAFKDLKLSRGQAPHKPCFLLAVIDAIEAVDVQDNEIRYEPRLLERFERYFKIARPSPENFRPYYPFVYLDNSNFWNLHQADGTKLNLSGKDRDNLAFRGGLRRVQESVHYASLNEELYANLIGDVMARNRYREVLISRYFPDIQAEMWAVVADSRLQRQFELEFSENIPVARHQATFENVERWQKINVHRDFRFRLVVLHAYDYRCAATGWHLETLNDGTLLEAAHIMPLSKNPDNRPQNGMALVPTVHRAMDEFLIVPGPDHRWHASDYLREQAQSDAGAKWLLNLHGNPVLLPKEKRLHPAGSVLEWRKDNLL